MTGFVNIIGLLAAVAIILMCGNRIRQMNWNTHKAAYVATPVAFLLWGIFLAADAIGRGVEWYQLFAALGVVTWLIGTHKTWANGPPPHTVRTTLLVDDVKKSLAGNELKKSQMHHVSGGRQ